MADTKELLSRLQTLVSEELKSVSYKWLAREFGLPANRAKQILFSFADAHRKQVHATYLLAGWTKDSAQQHVIKLVDAGHLQEAKAQLGTVTSLHVHSVQPSQPKDPADLWNADSEQTAALFERMVQQLEANCLASNALSAVACPEARRDPEAAARRRPAPAPEPAPAAKPPASKSGAAAKIDAIMKGPTAGASSASAGQKPASAPSAAGRGKASAKGKAGGLFGKAQPAKPQAKQAASKSAPVAAASVANPTGGGTPAAESGDDEEADFQPGKRKAGRQAVLADDSDSEPEPSAEPEPEAEPEAELERAAAPIGKAAAKKQAGGKGKRAKAAAAEGEAEEGAAGKQKGGAKMEKGGKRQASQPALGRAKAGDVAGVKRRKVSRTTINEKGEEVTETVWEDEGEEATGASEPAAAKVPQPPQRKAEPPAKSAPTRPSPQQAGGKGKGKGSGGGAGQRSLTSFFAKK